MAVITIFLAASAVRIDGEPLTSIGPRLGRGGGVEQEGFEHRLKFAMVPMVILYAAWNLVNWDLHKFMCAKFS